MPEKSHFLSRGGQDQPLELHFQLDRQAAWDLLDQLKDDLRHSKHLYSLKICAQIQKGQSENIENQLVDGVIETLKENGFGFILHNNEPYYFHCSNIKDRAMEFQDLYEGQKVKFTISAKPGDISSKGRGACGYVVILDEDLEGYVPSAGVSERYIGEYPQKIEDRYDDTPDEPVQAEYKTELTHNEEPSKTHNQLSQVMQENDCNIFKAWRLMNNLSQAEMAIRLDMSQGGVCQMEKKEVTARKLINFATMLGLKLQDLEKIV